jgi:hypothetical protein
MLPLLLALARRIDTDRSGYMNLDFKLQQFMKGYGAADPDRLPSWLAAFSPAQLVSLYRKDFPGAPSPTGPFLDELFRDARGSLAGTHTRSLENIMLLQYQKYFLPEFVLAHTDRASMQQSLEVRCPLLDTRIIEFANSLPLHLKIRNSRLKVLLFELLNHLEFPRAALRHPKKGFTFPLAAWLRGKLKSEMLDVLSPENIDAAGVFDGSYIQQLIDEHVSGKANRYRELWNLMVFFHWKKKYPELAFRA